MAKNNFQRLEEEEIDRLPDLPLGIANNVYNNLNNLRTFGSVIDLYLSKIIDVFVMMTGGNATRSSHTSGHGSPTEPDSGIPGRPSEE